MDMHEKRSNVVRETMAKIKSAIGDNADIPSLNVAKSHLSDLAGQHELFPESDFPVPTVEEGERTFCLYKEDDGRHALYINAVNLGIGTIPHDHGNSWAMVAAIHGQEKHMLYTRKDDGSKQGVGLLEDAGEITISPGEAVSLLAGGIHSVEAVSAEPILMLHCYGYGFEHQTGRKEYDTNNGTYVIGSAAAGIIEDMPLHPAS